jgi:hypothetical protein
MRRDSGARKACFVCADYQRHLCGRPAVTGIWGSQTVLRTPTAWATEVGERRQRRYHAATQLRNTAAARCHNPIMPPLRLDYSPPTAVILKLGRGFCGRAKDLCIFFSATECQYKYIDPFGFAQGRLFTPRPPRPAKEAGRGKAAGAPFG